MASFALSRVSSPFQLQKYNINEGNFCTYIIASIPAVFSVVFVLKYELQGWVWKRFLPHAVNHEPTWRRRMVCAAPVTMWPNLRKCTDVSELFRTLTIGSRRWDPLSSWGVPACCLHVIEPWYQHHKSISTNGIVDIITVVHATRPSIFKHVNSTIFSFYVQLDELLFSSGRESPFSTLVTGEEELLLNCEFLLV